jgi:hypothetical protein
MIYHILPNNDLKEHVEDSTCVCEPVLLMQENGDMIFRHNPFDCREVLEQAIATESTDESIKLFTDYVDKLYYLSDSGLVSRGWRRAKVKYAFVDMYNRWRKLDVDIIYADK